MKDTEFNKMMADRAKAYVHHTQVQKTDARQYLLELIRMCDKSKCESCPICDACRINSLFPCFWTMPEDDG